MEGKMVRTIQLDLLTCWLCVLALRIQCRMVSGQDVSVEQQSPCVARVDGRLLNLRPLDSPRTPRLTSQFTTFGSTWNYTFNPCSEFNIPDNPNEGFGDKCLAVSVCKYGKQGKRHYFFTLGFQQNGRFQAQMGADSSTLAVSLVFEGYRSMKGKQTQVQLVCDRERAGPGDALFQVVRDEKKLGNVVLELHHVCCCPDGCPLTEPTQGQYKYNIYGGTSINGNGTDPLPNAQESKDGLPEEATEKSNMMRDRTKVLIIVAVNMAIILMAGMVGFMCYNKRSHLEIYHKLPGVRAAPEPTLWQLASSVDLMEGGNAGAIISAASQPSNNSHSGNGHYQKTGYRDGEPQRRKSLCFPVLEQCGLPEDCITMGQRLGGGIFGDTYLGQWTGIPVAVKRITLSVHKNQVSEEFIQSLQQEVTYFSQQRHRNIVSVLGYCTEAKHPYILAEFITGQVVKDFIRHASHNLTWPHRVKILSQVADGMAFLHSTSPPILHRDLRCGNMFITNNDVVKVCDFGIVKLIQSLRSDCQVEDCACQGLYSACPPSIAWTAPEVLEHPNSLEEDNYITTAADVYSFGIVMWELITGSDPYEEMHTAPEVIEHVLSGGRPEIGSYAKVLPVYVDLMKTCWDANPEERYNFKQISVRLKEILHQAKLFQKALNSKGSRPKTRTLTFSDEIKVKDTPQPAKDKPADDTKAPLNT